MGATATVPNKAEIILSPVGEILGPGSPYAIRRSQLRSEYAQIVIAAKAIDKVKCQQDVEEATKLGRLLQNGIKEGEAFFKSIKSQIDQIKAPILNAEKEDIGVLNQAKSSLASAILVYTQEERKRQEAIQRAAEAAAMKAAVEAQIEAAIQAEELGELEEVDAILEQKVVAAPVFVQAPAQAKVAGKSGRVNYSATVTNLMELVKAVAEGKAPLLCLEPNMEFLNSQARSFKEGFSMPGCKLEEKESITFRA